MDSLTELYCLIDDFLPCLQAGMETPSVGDRRDTSPANQHFDSGEVDDDSHPVSSITPPPVQALLFGLCLPPPARRIPHAPQLSPMCGTLAPLRAAVYRWAFPLSAQCPCFAAFCEKIKIHDAMSMSSAADAE